MLVSTNILHNTHMWYVLEFDKYASTHAPSDDRGSRIVRIIVVIIIIDAKSRHPRYKGKNAGERVRVCYNNNANHRRTMTII